MEIFQQTATVSVSVGYCDRDPKPTVKVEHYFPTSLIEVQTIRDLRIVTPDYPTLFYTLRDGRRTAIMDSAAIRDIPGHYFYTCFRMYNDQKDKYYYENVHMDEIQAVSLV